MKQKDIDQARNTLALVATVMQALIDPVQNVLNDIPAAAQENADLRKENEAAAQENEDLRKELEKLKAEKKRPKTKKRKGA